jgi:hypothetical protein
VRSDCACDFNPGHLAPNNQNLASWPVCFPKKALEITIPTAVKNWDFDVLFAYGGKCRFAKEPRRYQEVVEYLFLNFALVRTGLYPPADV